MLDRPTTTFAPALPPAGSRILRPGMRALPPGVERYLVQGGQSLVVDIEPGDRIVLRDMEGGQACELIALSHDGGVDPSILGAPRQRGAAPSRALENAAL